MIKNSVLLFISSILCLLILTDYSFAEIKVTSVKGQAKYKTGKRWVTIKSGLKLAEGTKISTGIRSVVVLDVNGDAVTIRQMTMIKIEENTLSSTDSKIRIGLKRGGLNARISKIKKLRTSFKIATPVATASVRGTEEEVFYGPGRGMIVKVIEGEILAQNALGASNLLRGKLQYRQDNNTSVPNNVNAARQELARGGLVNSLTQEEKDYMEYVSDIGVIPDQISDIEQVIFDMPINFGYGSGNVHVTPVFP